MTLRLLPCLFLCLGSTALGQCPPKLPMVAPSPLLYVRFAGPQGARATFFQGYAPSRSYNSPVIVGMRPGYCYRMKLDNLPELPGVSVYPTIEVRGSLYVNPKLRADAHPATLQITQADIEAVINGALVTKVIYLEHPDFAEPTATREGQTLETTLLPTSNLLAEARKRGRPMLVVYFGQREPSAQELAAQNVANTILFPGEKVVGAAAKPPVFFTGFFDPRLGPKPPEEECLHDGGDRLRRAGLDAEGQLQGLDPEDTIAEYTDDCGRRRLACSNRVCLCVPRYVALRKEQQLALNEGSLALTDTRFVQNQIQIDQRLPSRQTSKTTHLKAVRIRQRPSVTVAEKAPGLFQQVKVILAHQVDLGLIEVIGTKQALTLTADQKLRLNKQLQLAREFSIVNGVAQTENICRTTVVGRSEKGPEIFEASMRVMDLTVCCCETPCIPSKPLVLIKCADRSTAKPGDIVTFTLKYSNHGGKPIVDVAVSDSLSGRLEYVEGSAESDRDVVFTVQPNEAGSTVLRWEISGKLLPGDSGRIKFKARVR